MKEKQRLLVVGGGGREHAFGWALRKSGVEIYTAPGNAGTAEIGINLPVGVEDVTSLAEFAAKNGIYLTVVGPEAPLDKGIVDEFRARNLPIFGPTKEAAQIETSKVWARNFMARHGIPGPEFETFDDYRAARDYIENYDKPCVVKADGLAEGKGAIVCDTKEQAQVALEKIVKKYGENVVIEERLYGREASVLAFTDGKTVTTMLPAEDYKPIFDGDQGENTGGMGGVCPHWEVVSPPLLQVVTEKILIPTVQGMAVEGRPYQGILYAGLMMTRDGPKVLEFNCRGGDPENQVILPLLKTPLLPILTAVTSGKLDQVSVEWGKRFCVGVVLASDGYPGDYKKGKEIFGVDEMAEKRDVLVFEAGTKWRNRETRETSGGRVLLVAGLGSSAKQAAQRAYAQIATPEEMRSGRIPLGKIWFLGAYYRTDIGQRGKPRY